MSGTEPSGLSSISPDGKLNTYHIRRFSVLGTWLAECPMCLSLVLWDSMQRHGEMAHEKIFENLRVTG